MNIDSIVTIADAKGHEESINLLKFLLQFSHWNLRPDIFFTHFGQEHSTLVVKVHDYLKYSNTMYLGYERLHMGTHFVTLAKSRFVVYTGTGRLIHPDVIYKALWEYWKNAGWDLPYWMTRRSYFGGRHWGRRGVYRKPKTLQSLKKSYSVKEDGEPEMRGRRKRCSLPTAWDDIWRFNQKNWKSQNKDRKQWMANVKKKVIVDEHYDGTSHW